MNYLVNTQTKEHRRYNDDKLSPPGIWRIVTADPEGWIKHDGPERQLPDESLCEMRIKDGLTVKSLAGSYYWKFVDAYRPILDDKPEDHGGHSTMEGAMRALSPEFDKACEKRDKELYDFLMRGRPEATKNAEDAVTVKAPTDDLIARLRASHKAASQLPDIIAELREALEPMGLVVMYASELAIAECGQELEKWEQANSEPDITDWRNWRKGDILKRVSDPLTNMCKIGSLYSATDVDFSDRRIWYIADNGLNVSSDAISGHFRFHSRPTKEQDK